MIDVPEPHPAGIVGNKSLGRLVPRRHRARMGYPDKYEASSYLMATGCRSLTKITRSVRF